MRDAIDNDGIGVGLIHASSAEADKFSFYTDVPSIDFLNKSRGE
jgi:hypothetical protein